MADFQDKLSTARRYVFFKALEDIWSQGDKAAEAARSEFTTDEYYRQLHGLTYEQVVELADPTGAITPQRYRAASLNARNQRASQPALPRTWTDTGYPSTGVRGTPNDQGLPRQ